MAMSVTNGFIVPFQIAALLWRLYATFLDKEAAELAGRDPNTKAANAAFVGLGVMFLSLPLMGVVLGLTAKAKQDQLVASDQRVRATTEALQGIRVLPPWSIFCPSAWPSSKQSGCRTSWRA
jgi:cytochrome b561